MTAPSLAQRALALFDELVELDVAERERRLRVLREQDPALHAEVAAMLAMDRADGAALDRSPESLLADATLADEDDDALIGQRIGPWRIAGIVGRGGMGAVYRGERADGEFQQQAAIKLIRLGLDHPELRRRFLRERQILARLKHPNIATLLDGGVADNGAPYFAMELIEGAPIDRWCDAGGLDVRARMRLFLQVCAAVQHAHQNLTVHRDLKPSNILVTDDGQAKLLDFGIAKLLEAGTDGGTTADRPFTPDYAAPEQIRGQAITTATDLYALGMVLYRLLADAYPFGATGSAALARLEREPEPLARAAERIAPMQAQARQLAPRALAAALRGDLSAIVHHCLQSDPSRRYPSAEALAADLRAWLDGRPIAARRGDRRYRLRKFVARHRWGVAAATLAILTLSGSTATAVWQAREAREQAALAVANAERAEAQAARALSTRDFAVGLFREADPLRSARGTQLTAVDLLKAAAQRVDKELEHAPETQAELRSAIGFSLYNLGDTEAGLALVERGLAQLRSIGAQGQTLAQVLQDRAIIRRIAADYAGAERDAREGLALIEHATGEQARLWRSKLRNTLATSLTYRGRHREGLELQQAVLEDRRVLFGDASPELAVDWNNLGNANLRLDRYAEAEAAFQRATDLMLEQHGPDHPRMVWLQMGLAMARSGQASRWREAETAVAEAERVLRKALPPAHPIAINVQGVRAYLLMQEGRYAEAEAAFARAIARARALDDPQAQVAVLQGQQGLCLLKQGRDEQAKALLAAAIAGFPTRHVADDPPLNRLQSAYGLALFRTGDRAHGEKEIRAALQRLQSAHFAVTDDYAEISSDLAALLEGSGRADEAQRWRQRARLTFSRVLGPSHPRSRLAMG
ncbi:serine/threonine-protein kinase [Luteimonas sp. SX5]|uniref:Serine/threonine-protein kinase n=1 Tax=Luteimonas galliterrae TaxID=2940486 RepID=A0ABT0MIY8_9GAMM|nr:serine/threonine-protein kinase [Luteimonas galliterrae]MCL1634826.1 serine/threonine-protein kinase [Luteimonas galliterrae]